MIYEKKACCSSAPCSNGVNDSAYASTRASVIQPGLSFAGTNANCSLIVAGDLGNESISATIKLNRGSINLKTWYTTGTGDLLFSDSSITTPKGILIR